MMIIREGWLESDTSGEDRVVQVDMPIDYDMD